MSGPVVPPLEITEVDGSPDGRPITKIIVSNGDLTISGREATIDTSGSSTTPGGSDTEVQFNDGGAFGGDAGFTYNKTTNVATITGGAITANLDVGNQESNSLRATDSNGKIQIQPEGTGDVFIVPNTDAGGTFSDCNLYLLKNATTDVAGIQLQDNSATDQVRLESVSGGDFRIKNHSDTSDINFVVTGAAQVEIQNATTDGDSVLSVLGNNNGTPIINLKNVSKAIRLTCEDDDKLYVRGPTSGERFTFDASSATGGITFPDGTSLVSAEGTAILSTGETGGTKFLREDGDGTSSWQAAAASVEGTAVLSTGETGATKFLREDGDGTCSWQTAGGGGSSLPFGPNPTITASGGNIVQYPMGFQPSYRTSNYAGWLTSDYTKATYIPFWSYEGGTLDTFTFYMDVAGDQDFEASFYSVTDGNPGARLAAATTVDGTVTGTISTDISGLSITLSANTLYWAGFIMDTDGGIVPTLACKSYNNYPNSVMIPRNDTSTKDHLISCEKVSESSLSGALPATVTPANLTATDPSTSNSMPVMSFTYA